MPIKPLTITASFHILAACGGAHLCTTHCETCNGAVILWIPLWDEAFRAGRGETAGSLGGGRDALADASARRTAASGGMPWRPLEPPPGSG